MNLLFVRAAYDKATQTRSVVLKDDTGATAELPTLVYCKGLVPMQPYEVVIVGGVVVQMKPLFKKDSEAEIRALFKKGDKNNG
ncbi:hypothetical protein [Paratractidigestivibacter sp.]|uniref:hypothetical protein n=1 Tax=Paratractidigestivibacter sp. TaxID=2847316 RepID=UPI002AC918A2|nr:hypothetical protein [Paratractidigestivibacter sp.]